MRALSVLAETGSFAKAAQRLNVTYPAVSQQVKALEEYLETTLIVREGRGFRLSNDGAELTRDLEIAFEKQRYELASDRPRPSWDDRNISYRHALTIVVCR